MCVVPFLKKIIENFLSSNSKCGHFSDEGEFSLTASDILKYYLLQLEQIPSVL